MWFKISEIILRNRITILAVIAAMTVFLGYFAVTNVKVNTKFANTLPVDDQVRLNHELLKEKFGEDGNIMVIGVENVDLFKLENFQAWYNLGNKIKEIDGIDSVFSVAHMYNIRANEEEEKFDLELITKNEPKTQAQVDSIKATIHSLPFYENLLFKDSSNLSLMMITVNSEKFNSLDRGTMIFDIKATAEEYQSNFPNLRYSGLPYIRELVAFKIKKELGMFVGLATGVMALLLFLFFRSLKIVLVCVAIVGVGVVWSMGTIGLFDFRLTALMALIPPLIIVIGIPNCIFLLNKYHSEYRNHGNKVKALSRVIQKIGNATFMTNCTTALGFGTFIFTSSVKMQHFGIIAFVNIIAIFVVCLCVIPIMFSFMDPPKDKHTKHLEKGWVDFSVNKLITWVISYRTAVYVVTIAVIVVASYGMSKMVTTGNISGDLPQGDPVLEDLQYLEREFGGVIPFEIVLDAKKEGKVTSKKVLAKIESVQREVEKMELDGQKIFAKSVSIVDAIKFANQALHEGDSSYFTLKMKGKDRILLNRYTKPKGDLLTENKANVAENFLDETKTLTRVSFQIADIGSRIMEDIVDDVDVMVDTILNPDRKAIDELAQKVYKSSGTEKDTALAALYNEFGFIKYGIENDIINGDEELADAFADNESLIYTYHNKIDIDKAVKSIIDENTLDFKITGTSVVFAKETTYMVDNLVISLILAVFIIAIIMSLLFRSIKMVLVSLVPNFIPLLVTAGIMGYAGIPIKPSTILVFSIAFGISIDDTIHYLAKYRQELKLQRWDIRGSVLNALKETGVSMIYTSIVLFFGFSMFSLSDFGGTKALGILVSVTLLVAMLANLVVLPSLLLSLDRVLTTKAFREPLLELIDEEEDIELDELEVQKEEITS